jgi:hypothetical protein
VKCPTKAEADTAKVLMMDEAAASPKRREKFAFTPN